MEPEYQYCLVKQLLNSTVCLGAKPVPGTVQMLRVLSIQGAPKIVANFYCSHNKSSKHYFPLLLKS